MTYKWGYKLIRECLMKTNIGTNFLELTLKSHGQGQKVKFKVNFQKCSEWPENSSESFWICKYANCAFDLGPITQVKKWVNITYKWGYKGYQRL